MAIHLIQRSTGYSACIKTAAATDTLVLLGEGVTAILHGADNCLATAVDVEERALSKHRPSTIRLISDAELVALCVQHSPVVSWNQP